MATLLIFDGLGGLEDSVLGRLQRLSARPENAVFFETVYGELDAIEQHLGPEEEVRAPRGKDLRRWLRGVDLVGLAERGAVASGVLIHVYHACVLQPRPGGSRSAGDDRRVGALGHSLGVLGALLTAAHTGRSASFLSTFGVTLRLLTTTLVRCHQAHAVEEAPSDLVDRYRRSVPRGPGPGPMASVTGLTRSVLEDVVAGSTASTVVGLTNTPTSHVLSGPPTELVAVLDVVRQLPFRTASSFLPGVVPFHSPLLEPVVPAVQQSRPFIGDLPAARDLRLPVFSPHRPRDLRDGGDLVDEFLDLSLLRSVDWPAALAEALSKTAADRIEDLGPGAGARRFTKECLRDNVTPVRIGSTRPDHGF